MPCVKPLVGWRSRHLEPSGKRKIVFDRNYGYTDMEVEVPCGRCWACRLQRSRDWAIRCMHEASLHEENTFITLTYNNENLPENGTLVKKHFQDFMKRLRKEIYPKKLRYYHCGEYGTHREVVNGKKVALPWPVGRPHYHAILFGHEFKDKELFREQRGIKLYTSDTLERIWGKGFVTVGDVTFESAAYVARYVMKKVGGEQAEHHYAKAVDLETGEFINMVEPEYTTMSRRPGIAAEWFELYIDDLKKDFITVHKNKGVEKMKPPKYYDGLFEIKDPEHYERIKAQRKKIAKERYDEDRHEAGLKIKKQQLGFLEREL